MISINQHKASSLDTMIYRACFWLVLLTLTACGGGGGGSGPEPKTPALPEVRVQGLVHKGPVNDALVTLYELNASGERSYVAEVKTNVTGFYVLPVNFSEAKSYVLVAQGGAYIDAVTGATVELADDEQLVAYISLTDGASLIRTINLTPLTTMASAYTDYLVNSQEMSFSQAISEGYRVFNGLFNLHSESQSQSIPLVSELSSSNQQTQNLITLLAGFDQLANDEASLSSAMSLLNSLVEDIHSDGIVGNHVSAISTKDLVEAAERFAARVSSNEVSELVVAEDARALESDLGTVSFNISPVADNDSAITIKDEPLDINASALLANDSDAEGKPLTITNVFQPSVTGAQVTLFNDVITYVPASEYFGEDSFKYEISDEQGLIDEAIVNVVVREAITKPVAVNDDQQTTEDNVINIPLTALLENDIQSIYGAIQFVRVVALESTQGQVTESNGQLVYEPHANFFGVDQFSYEIEDGRGNLSQAIVNVTVSAINDLPVVVDDSFSVNEDEPLNKAASAFLENDSDVEGDLTLITVAASALTKGVVTLVGDNVTFVPEAQFHGETSFSYTVRDTNNAEVSATVNVVVNSVNDLPIAQNDVRTTDEDTALEIAKDFLLLNDVDHDGDNLSVISVSSAVNGSAELTGGSVLFTPAENYSGIASFDYQVSDGIGEPVSASVQVTVNAVNDLPNVASDSVSVDEDQTIDIDVASLLTNDSDIEGDTLTVVEVVNHALTHGNVSLDAGIVTFVTESNFSGATSFGYYAEDSDGGRSLATVNVSVLPVNDAPVLTLDSYDTDEDVVKEILFLDLLSNDSDIDGDELSVTGVENATNGVLEIIGDDKVNFTPAENFFGLASFEYLVSDGQGESFTGYVEITVLAVNDAPVAVTDSASTEAYTSVRVDAISNDYDPESDSMTIDSVDAVSAEGGVVEMTAAGLFVYNAPAGFIGTDNFSYQLSDVSGATSIGQVNVNVFSEVGNVAAFAHATCSSEVPSLVPLCIGAIDGVLDGYPNDNAREWASSGEKAGAYIQLDWMQQVAVDSITLHDRPNPSDQVFAGVLRFSDGSTINVGSLDNTGVGLRVDFDPKIVSWVKFEITEASPSTFNIGLMEIVVEGEISPLRKTLNTVLYADLTTSTENMSLKQIADGVVAVSGNGWLSSGIGDYVRIDFPQPQWISKLSLRGMIRGESQINEAELSFSDGSSFLTGNLSNAGTLHEFSFEPKQVNWVQFTINSGTGNELGLGEMAVYSSLGQQNILLTEQFSYSGQLRQWSVTDEGPHNGPSNWQVQEGSIEDSSFILGQTTEGFEIGSYILSDVINTDEFDVLVRMLSDKGALLETDRGAGYIGIMFAYQDSDNFYRLTLSSRKGQRKLEKKVNGVFSELASSTQSYVVGEWSNVRLVKRNGLIMVYVNGVQALAAQDTTFVSGKFGVWTSRSELSQFDNLTLMSAPEQPMLAMIKPYEADVLVSGQLDLEFQATASVGGVEFVIDEGLAGQYSETISVAPYNATVSLNAAQSLSVTAYLLNDAGERMSHPDAKVVRENIGVRGIHLVAFGDSITEGLRDKDATDDVSLDTRNTSGGYQPVLNNHLSSFFNIPVTIENEGNPGDMAFQAAIKIPSILARGNGADGYLLMLGANDSSGATPVTQADFKQSVHDITLAIIETGARVWIAKTPPRLGRSGQSATIRGYNLRVNELVADFAVTHPGMVAVGPDFYEHFTDNPDGMDPDNVHPNGLGYSRMGQLWSDVLINSL